jgi:hypothetical protein
VRIKRKKKKPPSEHTGSGTVWSGGNGLFWLKTYQGFYSLGDGSGPLTDTSTLKLVEATLVIEEEP